MAYRTVLLHDGEVQTAKPEIKRLITTAPSPNAFAFHSKRKSSTLGNNETATGLYPALAAVGLEKGELHASARLQPPMEIAGINSAVTRQ